MTSVERERSLIPKDLHRDVNQPCFPDKKGGREGEGVCVCVKRSLEKFNGDKRAIKNEGQLLNSDCVGVRSKCG